MLNQIQEGTKFGVVLEIKNMSGSGTWCRRSICIWFIQTCAYRPSLSDEKASANAISRFGLGTAGA